MSIKEISKEKGVQFKQNQSGGQGSDSGGGSTKTGVSTENGGISGAAMFRDEAKVQATLKLLSTLEQKSEGLTGATTNDNQLAQLGVFDSSIANSQTSGKNIAARIERNILRSLFEINHVLLTNQAVTTLVYHLIMIFEFAQIMFHIFYRMDVVNEFSLSNQNLNAVQSMTVDNQGITPLLNTSMNNQTINSTSFSQGALFSNKSHVEAAPKLYENYTTFRIDYYFTFLNFQMYTLNHSTSQTFILVYSFLASFFLAFLIVLLTIANKAFEALKSEDIKDGMKILIQALSIFMSLFIFIFQIPLITIFLQGFLCDEDPNQLYTLPDIKCDSVTHKILVLFSSVTLTLYIIFLVIQQQLYASNNFESTLPWSSMERRLSIIRVAYKFLITAAFVLDKRGDSIGEIGMVCAFLCFFIVFKRCTAALIFRKSVFYAMIFYETSTAVLFFGAGIHNLSGTKLTITSLTLFASICIIASLTLIFGQEWRRQRYLSTFQPAKSFSAPHHYETYFYRLYEQIESNNPSATIEFTGLIYNHVQYCENHSCPCSSIVESLDDIKRYRKLKKKEEEEQQQLMWQQRLEREESMYEARSEDNVGEGSIPLRQNTGHSIGTPHSGKKVLFASSKSKKSTVNVAGRSLKNLIKRPSGGDVSKFQMITEGLQHAINPDKVSAFDELKKHGILNTASIAKKLALLMDEQKQSNFEFHEATQQELKKIKRKRYKFLAILVKFAIERFPQNVDLKIVNAFLQKAKLRNDFKAIFELMNCELSNPSIHDQFIIFRRKIEVEQNLVKQYQKNIQKLGQIDVNQVFQYEKYFLRYQMFEYITVNAAQSFWRELMQKHIDASILQERGHEISKFYEQIQQIAGKLQQIYPNEIKFLYRYGTFLLNIINNDYDAIVCMEKAVGIYQNKIYKKSSQMPNNEQTVFGENSCSAIIVMSATSTEVGTIIHVNDEIQNILGFQRKDLINRNINMIMPGPIAKVHDNFIHRYFETARQTVIDIQRQLFGKSKEGYLREVDLIVKVYPQLADRIQFVGFIQRAKAFTDMDPPKTEFEIFEQQYIVTDQEGYITNVTEGLNMDLGLNAKFFNYTDSIFQVKFNINKICPTIHESDIQELMEQEGSVMQFDTKGILNNIELEQLTADEIMEVRSNLCQQQAFVQLKKLVLDSKFCTIFLYRLIILPKNAFGLSTQMVGEEFQISMGSANNSYIEVNHSQSQESQRFNLDQMSVANSSVSSATSNAMSFNNIIKDFKKALTERQTPTQLIILNRVIFLILLATIALTSIIFVLDRNTITALSLDNYHSLNAESRMIQIVQLTSNIRSYINIANNLEFDQYENGGSLHSVDRFEYLQKLIQNQAIQLQQTHQFITKLRFNDNDGGDDAKMGELEFQTVDLYRLDQSNKINSYSQPFRVAIGNFLNNILSLNNTKKEDLILQASILINAPQKNETKTYGNTTATQKNAFFILANGMRSIRVQAEKLSLLQRKLQSEDQPSSAFLIIMVLGLIISVFSTLSVLYQIFSIEKNKAEILSLYALLSMKEIATVFKQCYDYMVTLDEAKLMGQDAFEAERTIGEVSKIAENPNEGGGGQDASNPSVNSKFNNIRYRINQGTFSSSIGMDLQQCIERARGANQHGSFAQRQPDDNDSQISEEEKEAMVYKKYIQRKKIKRIKDAKKISGGPNGNKKRGNGTIGGHDLFMQLIKKQFEDINAKDELNKTKNLELLKRDDAEKHKEKAKRLKELEIKRQQSVADMAEKKRAKKKNKKKKGGSADAGGKEDEEHSKDSSEDEEEEEDKEKHHHHHKMTVEEQMDNARQGNGEMNFDEIEERKKNFFKTIKNKSGWSIMVNLIVGLIFSFYFVQMNLMHSRFETGIQTLRNNLPYFFDRYRSLMLSYSFLRERIINNNTLSTYEHDDHNKWNLDYFYNDFSSQIEQELLRLKNDHPDVVSPLTDYTKLTDSEVFCQEVIGQIDANNNPDVNVTQEMKQQALSAYQDKVTTVLIGFQAAETGNIAMIVKLKNQGFNINTQDYDRRSLLHVATRAGQIDIVKYLSQQTGVFLNSLDRWGSTPLNYAQPGTELYQYLQSRGALLGTAQNRIVVRPVKLSDNEFRLFQAAYQDNLAVLQGLLSVQDIILDVNIQDSEGRTPLSVAASEGNLQSVKYLQAKGAQINIEDARGNTALGDANRGNMRDVITYMNGIITDKVIIDYCSEFSDGLLRKGTSLAIGDFRKRFSDLYIKTTSPVLSYKDRLQLLQSPKQDTNSTGVFNSTAKSIQNYFSTQELYLYRILNQYIVKMTGNFTDYTGQYSWITQLTFLIFLGIQLIIILFLRDRLIDMMKEEVFQSRGILNLIPDEFFDKNRGSVESLIKRLKY